MKKFIVLSLLSACIMALSSCEGGGGEGVDYRPSRSDTEAINLELARSFNYFMATTNLTEGSAGYGLVRDRYTNSSLSSIAATGFALASYPVWVEEGHMSMEEASGVVSKTLDTMLRIQADPETSYEGCISHFVNMNTGKRSSGSEISTIDTAILVSGAIVVGEYFKGEIKEKAETLWSNLDYNAFEVNRGTTRYISMGVDSPTNPTQLGPWDYYAEQLMIYIIGAGNPNEEHRIDKDFYDDITKRVGEYGGYSHIHSWFGALFTYQFSHAFFDFSAYEDENGINWFENSVNAAKSARAFSIDRGEYYATLSANSWGLGACDTPLGYNGYLGSEPRGWTVNDVTYYEIEGTVAPYSALGCMPFTPKESLDALHNYHSISGLNDETYGLKDSYNLSFGGNVEWYCSDFVGIDKGITVLQLFNYKSEGMLTSLSMENEYVIDGFINNGFVEVEDE